MKGVRSHSHEVQCALIVNELILVHLAVLIDVENVVEGVVHN